MEFKVGDRVEYMGYKGTIIDLDGAYWGVVLFRADEGQGYYNFHSCNGRYEKPLYRWCDYSELVLISE